MKITEIAFTGYPVSDMARARHFYEQVLGLKPGEFDHELASMPGKYWVEYDVGGATFAISNAWEPSGRSGPSVAFEVEDLDSAVKHLKQAGVTFLVEHIESPWCDFALIADPDGNGITIHRRKSGCGH